MAKKRKRQGRRGKTAFQQFALAGWVAAGMIIIVIVAFVLNSALPRAGGFGTTVAPASIGGTAEPQCVACPKPLPSPFPLLNEPYLNARIIVGSTEYDFSASAIRVRPVSDSLFEVVYIYPSGEGRVAASLLTVTGTERFIVMVSGKAGTDLFREKTRLEVTPLNFENVGIVMINIDPAAPEPTPASIVTAGFDEAFLQGFHSGA